MRRFEDYRVSFLFVKETEVCKDTYSKDLTVSNFVVKDILFAATSICCNFKYAFD